MPRMCKSGIETKDYLYFNKNDATANESIIHFEEKIHV